MLRIVCRLSMVAAVSIILVSSASAQKRFTAAELNASKYIICTWNKGTADNAVAAIKKAELTIEYKGTMPFGVCTGKLTEEKLAELLADKNIKAVEPDLALTVNAAPEESVKEITDEVVGAYEHAGRMVCVWKKGKKKEALEEISKIEQLRVVFAGESSPFAICDWKTPLKKETLTSLKKSELLETVEPDLELIKNDPQKGRVIEFPNGTPISITKNGTVQTTPEDPEIGKLWGMNSINAPKAWTCANRSDVVVAVIDSGIDVEHEDLKANIWVNTGEVPNNGKDDDSNGHIDDYYGLNFTTLPPTADVQDRYGHGSHVAGTIGAVGNNKIGVAGVCWRTQLMALKVFDDQGVAPQGSGLAAALDYAVARKARVVNLSLSWGADRTFLRTVLDSAQEKGVLVVCAAGNLRPGEDRSTLDNDAIPLFPASFPNDNIIAVANITEQNGLNDGSHFGRRSVDLGAPGTDVYSTYPTSVATSGYASLTGTSMATPHVAGAAALVWGQQKYASSDFKAIKKLLLDNAKPTPSLTDKCVTGGRLDIGFLCGATPPPGGKPPVVICPPPQCYIPCPPRRHFFYRFRCGR